MWYFPFQREHSNHISSPTLPAFCSSPADSQEAMFAQQQSSSTAGDNTGWPASATQAHTHYPSADAVLSVIIWSLQDVRKLKRFIGWCSNYHRPTDFFFFFFSTGFWEAKWILNALAFFHTHQPRVNYVLRKCFNNSFFAEFTPRCIWSSEMNKCSTTWVLGHSG